MTGGHHQGGERASSMRLFADDDDQTIVSLSGPNLTRRTASQMSGYLFKKSSRGEWQRRYFETNGAYLTYYHNHRMAKLLAAVNMPQVGVIEIVDAASAESQVSNTMITNVVFKIALQDRDYLLRAASYEEAKLWVDFLIALRDGRDLETSSPYNANPLNQEQDERRHLKERGRRRRRSELVPTTTIFKSSRHYLCCRAVH